MGKTETIKSRNGQVDEKLLKPFTLGWTREVVKRVVAKSPVCDIYYFSPDGKKLRSPREVKAFLTDGLTLDCFSFKREIFGVDLNFETVRNANFKRKLLQKKQRNETEIETKLQPGPLAVKKIKIRKENLESSSEKEGEENAIENVESSEVEIEDDTQRETAQKSNKRRRNALAKVALSEREKEMFKMTGRKKMEQNRILTREKHLWKPVKKVAEPNNEVTKNTHERGTELEIQLVKIVKRGEKEILSTSAEAELKTRNDKIFLRSREKSVPSTSPEVGTKYQNDGTFSKRREKSVPSTSVETELKRKNKTFVKSKEMSVQNIQTETEDKSEEADLKRNETPVKNTSVEAESEKVEEAEKIEEEQELGSADLKSIVQKNIGKYRKLREKQKLKLISAQRKKMSARMVNNSRAESFLKNRNNYLKPLQRGWRRELVYRSNCSKAGLQADVYYFHPNGKKFRSIREILEYPEMTGGLSIDFFSFRKEAVGCGEPLEVIRKARTFHKTLI